MHPFLSVFRCLLNPQTDSDDTLGFLEKVYENALALELREAGCAVAQKCGDSVRNKDTVVGEYFVDASCSQHESSEAISRVSASFRRRLLRFAGNDRHGRLGEHGEASRSPPYQGTVSSPPAIAGVGGHREYQPAQHRASQRSPAPVRLTTSECSPP